MSRQCVELVTFVELQIFPRDLNHFDAVMNIHFSDAVKLDDIVKVYIYFIIYKFYTDNSNQ